MEVMSDAAKKELHDLVDALPKSEIMPARRYLQYLRDHGDDQIASVGSLDPFEDMPDEERARLHACLAQSRKEVAEGKVVAAEDALSHLRSRRE